MKLGKAEALGMVEHHHGGIGNVHAHFDHGGGDQGVDFTIAEAAHHLFLFLGGEPAVHEPHLIAGEALAPFSERLGGGFRLERLAFLHQRIDEVGLAALSKLVFDKLGDVGLLGSLPQSGDHLAASGRFFVEQGNVKVTVNRHGQGARDGRGGHDEHIGHDAAADECGTLGHAELVLLVDYDEPEVVEKLIIVEQGVGADDDLGRSGKFEVIRLITVGGAQGGAHAQRFEPTTEGEVMLLGEDLGGSHQRGLASGIDGQQHCGHGHEGFTGAYIALQQAVHGFRAAHVGCDFMDRALLGTCQIEGQAVIEGGEQVGALAKHAATALVVQRAPPGDVELDGEKLLQGETPSSGICLGDFFREMR